MNVKARSLSLTTPLLDGSTTPDNTEEKYDYFNLAVPGDIASTNRKFHKPLQSNPYRGIARQSAYLQSTGIVAAIFPTLQRALCGGSGDGLKNKKDNASCSVISLQEREIP